MENKDKETIKQAIIHLNGYKVMIEKVTGFKSLAVRNIIKKLEAIKWQKK